MSSRAYTFGFRQGEDIKHAEPLGLPLTRRLMEAARYRAVLTGVLPADESCDARLLPVGGPPEHANGVSSSHAYFAEGLCVRLSSDSAVYERELHLAVLRPWVTARASRLTAAGLLEAGELFDLLLAVGEADVPSDPYRRVLPPLSVAAPLTGTALAEEADSLHPELERDHHVRVRMPAQALEENLAHCLAEPEVERAGVFVGRLAGGETEPPYVAVQRFVEARHTEAEAATVVFTRATWEDINRRLAVLEDDLAIVGWSHSHPNGAVQEAAASSALFMSGEDVEIMAAHFDAHFHFAVVVDPTRCTNRSEGCAVFGWNRSGAWLEQRSIELVAPRREEKRHPPEGTRERQTQVVVDVARVAQASKAGKDM